MCHRWKWLWIAHGKTGAQLLPSSHGHPYQHRPRLPLLRWEVSPLHRGVVLRHMPFEFPLIEVYLKVLAGANRWFQ